MAVGCINVRATRTLTVPSDLPCAAGESVVADQQRRTATNYRRPLGGQRLIRYTAPK